VRNSTEGCVAKISRGGVWQRSWERRKKDRSERVEAESKNKTLSKDGGWGIRNLSLVHDSCHIPIREVISPQIAEQVESVVKRYNKMKLCLTLGFLLLFYI
jgi:hypothetical protein